MVFHRDVKKAVKPTVSADEQKFVGEYNAQIIPPKDQSTPGKKKEAEMMEHMKDAFALELRADNTFSMNMIMGFEGTWKLTNGKIKLSMEGLEGMASAFGAPAGAAQSGAPTTFTPRPDGSLKLESPDPEKGELVFRRK